MVWCQVAWNWWDFRRPPLFILLFLVFFREFIKRDHLGFVFSCIFRREHGPRLSLHLTSLCVRAFLSWCHSQLRERQFLISCLLNHRPPDCAAKITSLFDEESLLVIFFFSTLKTSISGVLLLPHFSEIVVVTVTCYCYCVWCQGQYGYFADIIVLLNSHRNFANPVS